MFGYLYDSYRESFNLYINMELGWHVWNTFLTHILISERLEESLLPGQTQDFPLF